MKERSIKADKYFESEKYFEEQFRLVEKGQVIKSDDDTKESYIKGGNRVSGDSQVSLCNWIYCNHKGCHSGISKVICRSTGYLR